MFAGRHLQATIPRVGIQPQLKKKAGSITLGLLMCLLGAACLAPNLVLDHQGGEVPAVCSQVGHLQTAVAALYCLLLW